ncbi:MAG: hypothetical protein F6K47_11110 [Symploca sp. SIO2E6]|nr:hypothetical protein [Symploca sp. SIO2E6]
MFKFQVSSFKFQFLVVLLITISGREAVAQNVARLQPAAEPLNLSLLEQQNLPPDGSVITAASLSQEEITIPSLWWADQQFGGKLLDTWIAYLDERRIDLVVRRQFWSIQDYFEHYRFVNQMGTLAREYHQDYGYNIRVFNQLGEPLGAYTCDYNHISEENHPHPHCQVELCEIDNLPLGGTASDFCRIKPLTREILDFRLKIED